MYLKRSDYLMCPIERKTQTAPRIGQSTQTVEWEQGGAPATAEVISVEVREVGAAFIVLPDH